MKKIKEKNKNFKILFFQQNSKANKFNKAKWLKVLPNKQQQTITNNYYRLSLKLSFIFVFK